MTVKRFLWRRCWVALAVLLLLLAGTLMANSIRLEAKAWLAQQFIATAWQETLAGRQAVRPWPGAGTWPVARVLTPDAEPLYALHGFDSRVLAFGPGHLPASSLPGQPGPMVMAAHQDSHFRFLEGVSETDVIEVQTADGRWHSYQVASIAIVDSREERLSLAGAEDSLLLVTCYPFGDAFAGTGSPYRYVARAERLSLSDNSPYTD